MSGNRMAKRESARVRAQGRIENEVSKTRSAVMGERLSIPHFHTVIQSPC